MPKKIQCPTAEQLSSSCSRAKIAKASLRAALTEARKLGEWAGRRVPNGPTSGFLTQGYVIGHTGDLDIAIALIVARVREEATTKVRHAIAKTKEMALRSMRPPTRAALRAVQLAVRKTGRCNNCGTDFVFGHPGYRPPPRRTPKYSATGRGEAALYGREFVNVPTPAQARARKARGIPANMPLMDALQPEAAAFGRDFFGPDQSVRPRKEKIPNHKRSPTGKHPKASKGKRNEH